MSVEGFRLAYQKSAGNVSFSEQATSAELSAGTPTRYFNPTPFNGKGYVLGVLHTWVYTLTATGPATLNAGVDALDPILTGGQLQVGPSAGVAGRSQSFTRAFLEFCTAAVTNVSPAIAALTSFASAGSQTVTVSIFIPIGGPAGSVLYTLPAAVSSLYASGGTGVTASYTSCTSQVVSSDFSGVVAFREEKTPSLGTSLQDVNAYAPKDIAPDVIFMQGETSSTITQAYLTDIAGQILVQSTTTSALQSSAAAYAPIAGATYTTSAGFVIACDGKNLKTFMLAFASSTTHYIGFLQVQGGGDTAPPTNAQPTNAPAAVEQVGAVTATGQVASQKRLGSGAAIGGGGYRGRPFRGRSG